MKTTNLLFLLLPLLLLCSCKKKDEKHTSAKGTVIDATTQQPVPYARVGLVRQVRNFFTYGYQTIDTVQAGPDGKYSLSFEADENYYYFIYAEADRYIHLMELVDINSGEKNIKNLKVQPEGFLIVKILNSKAANNKRVNLNEYAFGQQTGFRGGSPDSEVLLQKRGNMTNQIVWFIYTDGNAVGVSYNANVYCPAHDTTTFTIEY